ncbi:unnamed protein product [Vicia faba]|uniref:Reverse transcriptase n=1 Tax=Vicia faba TaxID=3906 RepID=A0AAV1B981_VICFA|nr:unnamed protein product [Vicia faba]
MEKEVLSFYSDLVGTATTKLNHMDIDVIRKGAQLIEASKASLIKPFSKKEVWDSLNNIADDKTPGLDGFSAKFFKSSWNIVKSDLFAAIHDFYQHNHILAAINYAVVSLIHKIHDVEYMKDLRPISCCTTMYKIL